MRRHIEVESFICSLTKELARNLELAGKELKEPYSTRSRTQIEMLGQYLGPDSRAYKFARNIYTGRQLVLAKRGKYDGSVQ